MIIFSQGIALSALIQLLLFAQANCVENLRKRSPSGDVSSTTRALNWTETEDGSPSPYEFLALSLLGSVVMVGICYNLNRGRDSIEIATLSQQEQHHTGLVEPTHQIVASQSLVNKEENFHVRLQETELAVRRELDGSDSNPTRVPETGLYKGTKNTVDIEVTLIFYRTSDPPGYNVQGYGKDIISETTINIGFLNEIGEMYWLEERKRAGGNFAAGENARKYTTGSYNFQTNEFQGWFESSDGLRGRCHFVLVPDADVSRDQHKEDIQIEAAPVHNSMGRRSSGDKKTSHEEGDIFHKEQSTGYQPAQVPSERPRQHISEAIAAQEITSVDKKASHGEGDIYRKEQSMGYQHAQVLSEKPQQHASEAIVARENTLNEMPASDFSLRPSASLPLHLSSSDSSDDKHFVRQNDIRGSRCRSALSWTS